MLLTKIPFYKEVVVMSFCCDSCGYENNELQPGGEIAAKGIRLTIKVTTVQDLNRKLVKSDFTSIRIEELDFEIPAKSQKGEVTTVEGIFDRAKRGLSQDQVLRRIQDPDGAAQIDAFLEKLDNLLLVEKPFTIVLEDISGNTCVENVHAPKPDKDLGIVQFMRTKEQNHELGIFTHAEIDETQDNILKPIKEGEWTFQDVENKLDDVMQFPTDCPECSSPCMTNMKMTNIPHFKEVVIMATNCDNCGHRTNEVKSGGGIEPEGVRFQVRITGPSDLCRDILKSETCGMQIPELELEVGSANLGGAFTTVEGIMSQMRQDLETNCAMFRDSQGPDCKMAEFLAKLDDAIAGKLPVTLCLDDPAGNSYIQALTDDGTPDENLTVETYQRNYDQNEELGLNDMKTENYETED
jgi:zinc finger protein